MGTTGELLKGGGTEGAGTERLTKSSRGFTFFLSRTRARAPSTRHMSGANLIPQTNPQEEYTLRNPFSFSQYNFQQNSTASSSIHNHPSQQPNTNYTGTFSTPKQQKNESIMLTRGLALTRNNALDLSAIHQPYPIHKSSPRFDQLLPLDKATCAISHKPYHVGLVPLPSTLRPHCPARDRLRLWHPASSRPSNIGEIEVSETDLERILDVINVSWAKGTRNTYRVGLLVYHVFCDSRHISEEDRSLASPILIIAFISSCAGSYAGGTLANYVFVVRAWHILHGLAWNMDNSQVKAALTGAAILAPLMSRRPKRAPVTVKLMERIFKKLDLTYPLDAAVAGCFLMIFYLAARTGEFTLPTLNAFNPSQHVKPSDISKRWDRNNLEVTVFPIPKTKCALEGEDMFWSHQDGIIDPKAALDNHLRINDPLAEGPLFAYRHSRGLHPLTKKVFLERINAIAVLLGEQSLKEHRICIRATLEFLLRGVPFDVMKSLGHWSSDSFTLYLHQHATIIAPYIQDHPILEEFTCYTMPQARNR